MEQKPNWTEKEFIMLLCMPDISEDLILRFQLLPLRSEGAIKVVRQGIHNYHLMRDISMLSKMMEDILSREAGIFICSICSARI